MPAVKTAILGFGNPVRSDDAVGPYVIEQLQKRLADQPDVSLFDMGTSAFEVLFKLQGHPRIWLVDAVLNTGEPVGTLYKVPADELARAPQDDPLVFLHSLKWDQALSYAKKILRDEYPTDIEVYLIAIDNTRLAMGLSPEARQAADRVVDLLTEALAQPAVTPIEPSIAP
ncbi:MAG: hydrogenase maturation protease [Bernardetiaceae bacterium]|jgi:hydrogenase maturation protease|nr:hydrogenase maturation protease [Bernardetiaceae bacterium]